MTAARNLFAKTIDFAEGLALPLEFGGAPIALLAQRGRGKTRTAKRLAESFLKAGIPPIILDPVGVWWGLRFAADGQGAGLDIPILGGHHGDKPLLPTAGEVIAEALVRTRRACILDLTGFKTLGEQRRFVSDFAETFYRGKMKDPSPHHLILEEAQEFAPERPGPDEARMLGAFIRIFGQGRNFGIGATLISLFPQLISKRVLNLAEVLLILGLRGKHERKAVQAWLEDHEVPDEERRKAFELLQHLGWNKITKKDGGALIWIPDMSVFGVHNIVPPTTFDSSKTPEPGEKRIVAGEARPLDLDDLAKAMAATEEEAKANDPKLLRAEIARLKSELAKKPGAPAAPAAPVEIPVVPQDLAIAAHKAAEVARQLQGKVYEAGKVLEEAAIAASTAAQAVVREVNAVPNVRPSTARQVASHALHSQRPKSAPIPEGGYTLKGKMKDMLGMLKAFHPNDVPRKRLATLVGMSPESGTFSDYMSLLRTQSLIAESGGGISLGPNGVELMADVEALPPTQEELVALWMPRLKGKSKVMLQALIDAYPDGLTRAELGAEVEMADSGTFSDYLSLIRTAGLLDESRGKLFASEDLFPEGR